MGDGRAPEELDQERAGYSPDGEGLRKFIEERVLLWCQGSLKELRARPAMTEQAFGEALSALQALDEHEAYLNRKLERTLETLARRQATRRSAGW